MKVSLLYFKLSGKYYSEGSLDYYPRNPMMATQEVLEFIVQIRDVGELPEVINGKEFFIVVTGKDITPLMLYPSGMSKLNSSPIPLQ